MAFNLRKQAQISDPFGEMMYDVPFGVNPVAAKYLWENIYREDPTIDSMQDMITQLGPDGVQDEYERMSNPVVVNDLPDSASNMQNVNEQMQDTFGSTKKKYFNLKKAQMEEQFSGYPVEQMEIRNEQMDDLQIPQPPFSDVKDFMMWVDNTDQLVVLQALTTPTGDNMKEAIERYYTTLDEGEKAIIAGKIFQDPSFPLGKEKGIMAQPSHVGAVNELIKKLATNVVNKNKKKVFNLTKTAQHKTMDNAILWGPGQTRIDPFLHQPVSDWHIVERNKGFGLVVDDVWNIDYETIWRENIMDKYSRPYKDQEGNWVGGYLNKRFEIDRNIPETNNLQLKPGQRRKPILPEYGNTESRLQAARAAGDIAGADDTLKPFNWKEASKKKS